MVRNLHLQAKERHGFSMITISLCMIVKNEEKILRRCLDSVADLCEEIIIVDTGSTDSTKEIAQEYIFILPMRTKYWMRKTGSGFVC